MSGVDTDIESAGTNNIMSTYRSLGRRAAWTFAFLVVDFYRRLNNPANPADHRPEQASRLLSAIPQTGLKCIKTMFNLVKQVSRPVKDGQTAPPGTVQKWSEETFLRNASNLRDIGDCAEVIESNGTVVRKELYWLEKHTAILNTYPAEFGNEPGSITFRIIGTIADHIVGTWQEASRKARLPDGTTIEISDLGNKVTIWTERCRACIGKDSNEVKRKQAYQSARTLVILTGIVPWETAHGHGNTELVHASSVVL